MTVTLAEILDLSIMAPARVVAGQDRLNAPVRWVHVTEVPDLSRVLKGGELILTHGLSLPHPGDRRRFLDGIVRKGAAGIVLELGRSFAEVPPDFITGAEEHRVPLIALTRPVSFVELTRTVHTLIINRQYAALQEAERFMEGLMLILIGKQGIPAILKALGDVVSNPMLLLSRETGELLHAHPECLGAEAELLLALASPLDRALSSVEDHTVETLTLPPPWPRAVRVLNSAAGESCGDLYVLEERPMGALEHMAVARAQMAIAAEIGRADRADSRWRSASGMLVERLVTEGGIGAESVSRAAALGVTLSNRWLSVASVAVEAPEEAERRWGQLERIIRTLLSGHGLGVLSRTKSDHLVFVLSDLSRDGLIAKVTRGVELLRRQTQQLWPATDVLVGAATPTQAVENLPAAYQEAEASLRVQRFPGGRRRGPFFHTMGAERLLSGLPPGEITAFVQRELGALAQQDATHGTDLLRTLRALLDCSGRVAECARRLGVGRQTLYYRLQRLRDITGADLNDPEVQFRLGLALRLQDLAECL